MKTTKLLIIACAALTVAACTTPKNFNLFQDVADGQEIQMSKQKVRQLSLSKPPLQTLLHSPTSQSKQKTVPNSSKG